MSRDDHTTAGGQDEGPMVLEAEMIASLMACGVLVAQWLTTRTLGHWLRSRVWRQHPAVTTVEAPAQKALLAGNVLFDPGDVPQKFTDSSHGDRNTHIDAAWVGVRTVVTIW